MKNLGKSQNKLSKTLTENDYLNQEESIYNKYLF
jgi:hypothetical protein